MLERYQLLIRGVEAERKQEESYYLNTIAKQDINTKVNNGVAWYPVDIISKRYTVGEYLEVQISRKVGQIGSHRFKEGLGVKFFINLGNEKIEFKGNISFLRKDKMSIILKNDLLDKEEIPEKGLAGVELIYDERPYRVMNQTLNDLLITKNEYLTNLRNGIALGERFESTNYKTSYEYYFPSHLNQSQKEALQGCLESSAISIIHGPPGTGKTTTLAALIKALSQTERKILVCAPSNNAVDLLALKVQSYGIEALRVGNITRIGDEVAHLTMEEKIRSHQDWKHIKKVKQQANEAEKQAQKFIRNFGTDERKERHMYRVEARELRKWAKQLEEKLIIDIVDQSKVILTTLIGASHYSIEGCIFDTVVIDEASQCLEPECWVAIAKAKRVILAGDHKQLPPTVKSNEAMALGLGVTLLDLLTDRISNSYLLKVQYRMNDDILSFSNKQFYNNSLISSPVVGNRLLRKLKALYFIDTAGTGFEEAKNKDTFSYYNSGEFFIIREHIMSNMEHLLGAEIGVISPYAEQVRFLRTQISEDGFAKDLNIEIDSIDGFQGQEKDIIYISLVRSNDNGEIGFLADERRLNVALTRARMCVVVIGDSSTLGNHKLYSDLIAHFEIKEAYHSAWEYMQVN